MRPHYTIPPFCPNCGYDLRKDEVLVVDDWVIDPRDGVTCRGKLIEGLTETQVGILHSLAKDVGRIVSSETLGARHSDAEDVSAAVRIQIHRIREILAGEGIAVPFETVWRRGYRWTGGAHVG
ncbi:helix-turn-helix domain-containing protein [Sphingopyxis sp. GW247-27LB]|uniref:helix-turn-helix domain-containing protein n=1 Tax=Sphingopyxis sp. GW247-27LB TaxID=2012632 RepID=UPI000BA5A4AD|nr:helix-turn-helix domain-containing protein [Sphingopyxis sp. GW247-27LB]PAL23572.1 hypothetical protein CD928_05760 [Sphingopyxis sp. GW247-27LB]